MGLGAEGQSKVREIKTTQTAKNPCETSRMQEGKVRWTILSSASLGLTLPDLALERFYTSFRTVVV